MARRGTAETEVKTIISGKDKSQKAFRSLQTSLKNTSRTLQVVQGPLGPIAGRFTALSSAMGSVSARSIALTAGITGLTLAAGKSLKAFSQTDKQLRQLQAQLTNTGYAVGLTADQLEDMAQRLARSTLASVEEVRTAQGILLTFKSVSSDAFERATAAAQDLAASGMGSITEGAKQLGKALEDPKRGLSSLSRAGVTFTASQRDMIEAMVDAGDKAGALNLILNGVEGQIAGTGEGAAGGLIGKVDSLAQSWRNLQDAFGARLDTGGIGSFFDMLTKGIDSVYLRIKPLSSQTGDELRATIKQIENARSEIQANGVTTFGADYSEERLTNARELLKIVAMEEEVARRKGEQIQKNLAAEDLARAQAEKRAKEAEVAAKQAIKDQAELNKLIAAREAKVSKLKDRLDPIGALNRKYAEDQATINILYDDQATKVEHLARLGEEYAAAMGDVTGETERIAEAQKKLEKNADSIAQIMGDGFKAATLEGQKFGDVMGDMLKRIAEQLVEILVIQNLVQGISGGIQGAFGGAGGTGAAPIVERGVPVATGAIGGMRSGATLIGEKGPEVLNLPPGSKITPNHKLGGDTNIIVNNNASGTEVETETERQPDGSELIKFIINTVSNDLSTGGSTSRAVQSSFGSRQQAVVR